MDKELRILQGFFLLCCWFFYSPALAQYTVSFLPTPNGDGLVTGAGGGQIVGAAFGPGGGPALWNAPNYEYVQLGAAGYSNVQVEGVGGGKQVGYGIAGSFRALMWSGSAASVVDLNPAGYFSSVAQGTDGKTQVGSASPNGFNSHAVMWSGTAASAVSLHPAGYENSGLEGVWEDVQVGGAAGGPTGGGAAMWRGTATSMQLLPTPTGFTAGDAHAIYGNQIVGRIVSFAAVVWDIDKWTYTSLGEGVAIDTNGQHQVGWRGSAGESRALRWTGSEASVLDLHELLPSNIIESLATGIDEDGTIVGWGATASGSVPIVWTPVPELSTCMALGASIGLILLRRRRQQPV